MTRKRYEIIASTFDKRGRVIASGKNDYSKSHPLMQHFSKIEGEHPDKVYKHAELVAVLKSRGQDIHSILVQRFDSEGNPKLAMPCKTCKAMLKAFGIQKILYTTEEGIKEYESTCQD